MLVLILFLFSECIINLSHCTYDCAPHLDQYLTMLSVSVSYSIRGNWQRKKCSGNVSLCQVSCGGIHEYVGNFSDTDQMELSIKQNVFISNSFSI